MLLDIKDLKIYFKGERGVIQSVNGVNLQVEEGKTVALVGESGSGKSVTSLAVMQLLDKKALDTLSGEVLFQGENLLEKSEKEMEEIRGKEISMIFQEPMTSLNPALKIGYQLDEVYRRHFSYDKKKAKEKSLEMIEKVEIPRAKEVYNSYPHQLSGGMRQRIMIAMALSSNPKLLIADEPTTALDVTIQAEVLKLMKKLKEEMGTSIIFITHDLSVVAEVADEVNVMYGGQIVESGDVYTLFENPLHPYTRGLMASRPQLREEQSRLFTIKGSVPDLAKLPQCCYFYDRCPEVMEICKEKEPQVIERGHGKVRCFLYTEEGENR